MAGGVGNPGLVITGYENVSITVTAGTVTIVVRVPRDGARPAQDRTIRISQKTGEIIGGSNAEVKDG